MGTARGGFYYLVAAEEEVIENGNRSLQMDFETTDTPTATEVETIKTGLSASNTAAAPEREFRELGVFVRQDGEIIGGAYGASVWDWVHINYLWVDAEHRKIGLGAKIMEQVEQEALQRGCIGVHLDTFSFQALPFYEKLGYEVYGEIEDHPHGHKRHYLKKTL